MKRSLLPLALTLCLALSGCSTTYKVRQYHGLPTGGKAAVILDDKENPDTEIHRAIADELHARGIDVLDSAAARSAPTIAVRYVGEWKWDMTMYLRGLDIAILEPASGRVLSEAHFKGPWLHNYPNRRKVVHRLFQEFDRSGVLSSPR